ncbi:MAG: MFS transporter [Coriobacteriales bacterium]|jgi:OFA family oxalate/formate antiporter-like MFS transporter|nr:MFS transporter [Coriobacteriales bacterium]
MTETKPGSALRTRRLLYLAFATLTLLVLGLIYAWSIFATPIGAQFETYKPMLGRVFQVSMFAFCLSALAGAQISRLASFRVALIVSAVLLGVGFVTCALFAAHGVWVLFVCYGVLAASGVGIAYNAIISLVNPWFPDRVGLSSGFMMMGFGVSSLVFGSLASLLIARLGGWQGVFYLVAAAAILVILVLAFMVRPAPHNLEKLLAGETAVGKAEEHASLSAKSVRDAGEPGQGAAPALQPTSPPALQSATRSQHILKTRAFWLYVVWSIVVVACGLMLIGTARQGAEALGVDTMSAGLPILLVGLVSTMNGLARLINGALFDKVGLVPVMVICALLSFVAMLALALSFASALPALYVVAAILIAFPYGGVPVMASAFARQRFRPEDFAMNLGINNLSIAAAALINIVMDSFIGPVTSVSGASASAPLTYGVLAALALVALVFTWLFSRIYRTDLLQIAREEASAREEAAGQEAATA